MIYVNVSVEQIRIYIFKEEETWGPYELQDIPELLAEGRIGGEDLAALAGEDDWKPLSELIEIRAPAGKTPPVAPAPPVAQIQQTGPQLLTPASGAPRSLTPGAAQSAQASLVLSSRIDCSSAAFSVFFVAIINLLLGILAITIKSEVLTEMGVGTVQLVFGGLMAVLGIFVLLHSKGALALALLVFVGDTLFLFFGSIAVGGIPPIIPLIIRVFLIVWMASGFSAMGQISRYQAAVRYR